MTYRAAHAATYKLTHLPATISQAVGRLTFLN